MAEPGARALPVLANLKLTLLIRHFRRQPANAVAIALVLLVVGGLGIVALVGLAWFVRERPEMRDTALLWTAWVFTLVWLTLPLTQFDAQRNLDLSGLRLLPLPMRTYTLAAVLDSVISPMGLLLLPLLLLTIPVLTLILAELPLLLASYALLLVATLALGQALFLSVSRLLSSRRFADLSLIAGLVLIFAFQGVNLLIHTGEGFTPPAWVTLAFGTLAALLQPLATWLYPGLATGVLQHATAGDGLGAALRATLLLAQCALALLLALRATRAFYEGEQESGGAAKRLRRRDGRAWLQGALGALFHRERLYLLRDPLLKALFLQALMGVAYLSFVMVILVLRVGRGEDAALLGPQTAAFALLGIALMLSYSESFLLFNKLGLEGNLLTHLLLSPVDRRRLLLSKSLFMQAHFLALNTVAVLGLGVTLGVAPLYIATALLMLCANSLVIDLLGNYVSIWFPFTYRRQGRQFRPLYAQTGCGFMLLYGVVTQLCNIAVLPLSAVIVLGAYFGGAAGLALGALAAGLAIWAAHLLVLPHAARMLLEREPEIIATLTRQPD